MYKEKLIEYEVSQILKNEGDYYIVYNVFENKNQQPRYKIWCEYYREGFAFIDVGCDLVRESEHHDNIKDEIYKRLAGIENGGKIRLYHTTRKVLLNKILTTKSFDLVRETIRKTLDNMKNKGVISHYVMGEVDEENGDKLYYCIVNEKGYGEWLVSVFMLREGYTVIALGSTIESMYDEEFLELLYMNLKFFL